MTHYDEFGVAPTASLEEIQRAHRNLARLLHPDRIQDEEARRVAEGQLKRLNAIYHILVDPERRRLYDLQLMRLLPVPAVFGRPPLPRPPGAPSRWFGSAAVAVICLAAGFQIASWWSADASSRLVREAGERNGVGAAGLGTAQAAAGPPGLRALERRPGETAAVDLRQLAEENRELRRALHLATAERDQALLRLASSARSGLSAGPTAKGHPPALATAGALTAAPVASGEAAAPALARPAAAAAPATTSASASASASAAIETPGRAAVGSSAPPLPVTSSAPAATTPRYAGTWIYSPPGGRHAPGDQYPAEYIEVVLMEREEMLWGRYRARYKVADRALNPEVEFFFEGKNRGTANRFGWNGNGGAKGEVSLRLLSESTMSLDWFTSQLGRGLTLGSGTAVLVRREDR